MQRLLLILALTCAFSVHSETTLDYQWLTQGKPSGSQQVTRHDDGRSVALFSFNDRGRGPEIRDEFSVNRCGQITRQHITGHSYMGAAVDESFRLEDGVAQWQSAAEQGREEAPGLRAYMAMNGAPESTAALVRAALRQENGRLDLLPAGYLQVKELLSLRLTGEDALRDVRLFELTGVGLDPQHLWLDEDNELFALAFGWMGLIRSGWETHLDTLYEKQQTTATARQQQQAKSLAMSLGERTLIDGVDVLDVRRGRLQKNSAVLIHNGRIEALGRAAREAEHPVVIDGSGLTLMPGLWDMHTHMSPNAGLLNIAAGITHVRDLANDHDRLSETMAAFERGDLIGPQVHRAGFIDQKSPYAAPTGNLATTLDEALEFVDWYAEHNYPQIKIYSSIDPAWVKPLAERIHGHGMRLSGHIPSFMRTEQAVRDGFDEIQHLNMLYLNFLAGPQDDTRTPLRFTLVGEKGHTLDLRGKPFRDFVRLLKKNRVVVDPTVTIFHSMFLNEAGQLDPSYAAIADHLPASVRRGLYAGELDINESNRDDYRRTAAHMLEMIKRLHKAGVQLVPGSDALAGFTLLRELELYVEAGIKERDVLRMATLDSARVAGVEAATGSIDVGKQADLILLQGNPLKDISALRRVHAVITRNTLYRPAALHRSIGIQPFVDSDSVGH